MKKFLFISFLIMSIFTSLFSCSGNNIHIEGKFNDNANDKKRVYLQTVDLNNAANVNIIDSAIIKNGKFTLNTNLENVPNIGFISVGKMEDLNNDRDNAIMATLVLEPGKIQLNLDKSVYTLAGTERNVELNKIVALINKAQKMQHDAQVAASTGVNTEKSQQDIITNMQKIGKEMKTEVYNFLKTNMNNKAGEFMFFTSSDILDPEQMKELLQLADTSFINMPEIKDLKNVLDNQISSIDKIFVTDMNGNKVKLSDYVGKGKYVLVDFWATWCGPCMREMPTLKRVYDKYKGENFEIVGVSVDDDVEAWKKTVKAKGMDWIQLHDSDKSAGRYYKVNSIPFTLLFDKSGNIINSNLRGDFLERELKKILN